MGCSCNNGYTVSLRDVCHLLKACAFPALDTFRFCGVECVDSDAGTALAELQRSVKGRLLDVQFEPGVVNCDIPAVGMEDLSAADEVFALLETYE